MVTIQDSPLVLDFFESGLQILPRNQIVKFQTVPAPDLAVRRRRRCQSRADGCAVKCGRTEEAMSKAETEGCARNLFAVVAEEIAVEHRYDGALTKTFGAPTQS